MVNIFKFILLFLVIGIITVEVFQQFFYFFTFSYTISYSILIEFRHHPKSTSASGVLEKNIRSSRLTKIEKNENRTISFCEQLLNLNRPIHLLPIQTTWTRWKFLPFSTF